MAKRRARAAKASPAASGQVCKCTPGGFFWVILAAIVMAIGIWLFISGIRVQWADGPWLTAMVWYAIGLFVVCVGKVFKMKACGGCPVHKM